MGVIPISLSKKSDITSDIPYPIAKRVLFWHDEKKQIINAINKQTNYRYSSESVYPINKRALLWPSEMEIIQNLLDDKSIYDDVVGMLKTR